MGIKEKIARKRLLRIEKEICRIPELPNLNLVKNIGVLCQPGQTEAFKYLQDYFGKTETTLSSLCVYDENIELITEPHIIPKDLNWLGFPKSGMVDSFVEMNFDILFNIALKHNVIFDYIMLVSKAKFKVGGQADLANYFDLNINIGQNQNSLYLVEQQIFYLSNLKQDKINE